MAFEELKESTDEIQKQAQDFIDNNVSYYKLHGFKIFMKSATVIMKFLLITIFLIMFLFFCSVAAALELGKILDSYALGFLCIGCIYLVVTILLFYIKVKVVERPFLEKFSEIFFNE